MVVVPLNFLVARALVPPWVLLTATVGYRSLVASLLQARRMVRPKLGRPINGGHGAVGGVIGGASVCVETLGARELRQLRGVADPHLEKPAQAGVVGSTRVRIFAD